MLLIFSAGAIQHAQAQTFTTIHSFETWGSGDGVMPLAGLARDSAGNLYGTTAYGGNSGDCTNGAGCGTVFKIDPSAHETVIYRFSPPDGTNPYAGFVFDSAGNLYGTTSDGGAEGGGTVFKIDPSGYETVLDSFSPSDGINPMGGVVFDSAGNLYGTTAHGGSGVDCYYGSGDGGCGTVFKLDPYGNYSVLHTFGSSPDDGKNPAAGLVIDPADNLYGTTYGGGSTGNGSVFKLDPSGNYSMLHSFAGGGYGWGPYASLLRDSAGNLYGTTQAGGDATTCLTFGCGTVFKIDPSGNETVLHSFDYHDGGGIGPVAGLIMDPAGNLYGTTEWGGSDGGTVFKLDPYGSYSVLHTFTGSDGENPEAGLLMDPSGNLYGTTSHGGSSDNGTIFKITLTTPFSAFDAKLNVTAGPHARFQLKATFTQGSAGGAIDPVTQGMMLAIGPYNATIPAGEFHMRNRGLFVYEGTINGAALQIRILQTRTNSYQVQLEASGMDLTSFTNPVPVTLTIGSNTGTTQVTAAHGL